MTGEKRRGCDRGGQHMGLSVWRMDVLAHTAVGAAVGVAHARDCPGQFPTRRAAVWLVVGCASVGFVVGVGAPSSWAALYCVHQCALKRPKYCDWA